jgi:hypothetical protein
MALKLKIWLLDVLKEDFDEVDVAMFHGVDGPCVLNFCISGIEKIDFHEVA